MEGIVKRYYTDRGFGFISVPGQKDIYFHISEVGDASDTLNFYVGDPVSFELGRDKKGQLMARNVVPL
ncbi:cold-shock protein [Fontibacillus sp. BL9]|uniref:cold-shock protein n=1 Tax=Fontibacillus sp. BL9 TaxID=3389971 RepID=UPI00397D5307